MIYHAIVDEFWTFALEGDMPEGQRRRHMMIEADDIHAAWKAAERTAAANVYFGPRPLGIHVVQVGRVVLPVEIHLEQSVEGNPS